MRDWLQRKLSTICQHASCRYESIDDPSTLRPGDHVTWHRPYLIWHHAVVTKQDPANRQITVHEYTLSGSGPFAAVVETKLTYAQLVKFCYVLASLKHRCTIEGGA